MRVTLVISIIGILFQTGGMAQCSKDLEKHETYNTGPIIETKDIVFHAPTITNNKDISVVVKDTSRLYIHFDLTYGTWRVGSKVDFKFKSGAVASTYITKWESESTGSYSVKRYDCQITSRDDLDLFYLEEVNKITVHGVGRTFSLSGRKAKKFNQYFKCAANTVGVENVNFKPAIKSAPDPYVDNTIVVSFGNNNTESTYSDIDCEYEKNQVDEFTGKKTTITKMKTWGDNLQGQLHLVDNKTFINVYYKGALGCSNVESYIIIKFMDGSTLKLMNLAKEDCGENPMLKVDITNNISILKVRDIEKIRVGYSDAHADVSIKDPDYIRGVLNKCL
ncbi:MAG: hypothetical protein WDZ35_02740 [Crocinitomicaceae bacterium]